MKTTACKICLEQLPAFMDRELGAGEADQVAAHLAGCAACSREQGLLAEALEALQGLPAIAPSADFDRVFWDKIRAARQAAPERTPGLLALVRRLFAPQFSMAASAALAIAIFAVGMFTVRGTADAPADRMQLATDIELFLNMEVIENSDALENFELIQMLDMLEQDLNG